MALALKFRDKLPAGVVDELDQLVGAIKGWWSPEHNDDGSHGDVNADSLTLQDGRVGELTDIAFDASRFFAEGASVWTVQSADQSYLRYSRIGQLAFVQFNLQGTGITVDTSGSLFVRLPELHALPTRDSAGSPAYHTGGILNWSDHAGGTNGIGLVSAQAQAFAGAVPSTLLQLDKCIDGTSAASMFGDWPITADLWISGSCWFTVEPNNVAVPYFGS
jgi:hypothetical protein